MFILDAINRDYLSDSTKYNIRIYKQNRDVTITGLMINHDKIPVSFFNYH